MKMLVRCDGFIGDVLFASSIAQKAKEEHGLETVDYQIRLRQPKLLLALNPFIDNVFVGQPRPFDRKYDFIVDLLEIHQAEPATIQYQRTAGIANPSLPYQIFTHSTDDEVAQETIWQKTRFNPKPVIGYVKNWIEKSLEFTKEEYWRGIDVPYLGYGGRHHDIDRLISTLAKKFHLIPIGLNAGVSQFDPEANDAISYSQTASLVKACDFVIGPEGGLTNLAAGVGTTVIMATDFIWQLYGPNGLFKKIDHPAMGPKTYFPEASHVHLDPFLDTDGLINGIISNVERLYNS